MSRPRQSSPPRARGCASAASPAGPAAAALALLLALGAMRLAAAPAPAPPASAHPDLVLVTIDTLRADATGFGGSRQGTTPTHDRIAAAGRVFTDAHAHNVVTLPSHVNLLTGLYPYQHGVRDNTGFRLRAPTPTLATVLAAAGYATGAFVAAEPLDSRYGLARGFAVYDDRVTSRHGDEEFALAERRGDQVVAAALEWWRAEAARPRFLWVHLYDPHAPYSPPPPHAARFSDPYLGEVAAADAFLAPLLGEVTAARPRPALLVVTADHGEARGDHGERTHGLFAYEPTLRVPLLLWGKGVGPGRDARAAGHVDVFPTLLAAAGVAPPPGGPARPGRSLLRAWSAEEARRDLYFEALSAALNRGWAPLRGLLRERRKAIHLPLAELYDLAADPGEARNLVDQQRPAIRAAFAALPRESTWPPPREAVSDEEAARLRSLGYLAAEAGGDRPAFAPEDDPKRLIALDHELDRVVDLHSRGGFAEAVRAAEGIVRQRPGMALGHSLLAQSLLSAGREEEALAVMRRAHAGGVTTPALTRQLGLLLAERGAAEEALAVLAPLARSGDAAARCTLDVAHSEAGRQREAFELLQAVLAEDPRDAEAWERLALVELRLQHWPQARDAARRALALHPTRARAWNDLGVALFQLGAKDEALDAWERAAELDPRLWDALLNLGLQGARQGRTAAARAALERFVAGAPPARYARDLERAGALLARLRGEG